MKYISILALALRVAVGAPLSAAPNQSGRTQPFIPGADIRIYELGFYEKFNRVAGDAMPLAIAGPCPALGLGPGSDDASAILGM